MKEDIVKQREIILVAQNLLCPLPNTALENAVLAEQQRNAEWSRRKASLLNASRETTNGAKFWYQALKDL